MPIVRFLIVLFSELKRISSQGSSQYQITWWKLSSRLRKEMNIGLDFPSYLLSCRLKKDIKSLPFYKYLQHFWNWKNMISDALSRHFNRILTLTLDGRPGRMIANSAKAVENVCNHSISRGKLLLYPKTKLKVRRKASCLLTRRFFSVLFFIWCRLG